MARFAELTDAELMQLLDDKLTDSSKNTLRYSVSVLSNYAIAREGTLRDVEQLPPESLDTYLSSPFRSVV